MTSNGSKKKAKRTVALDGDKLGQIVGALVGLTALLLCFYHQEVDWLTAVTRTGWAFVIGYGATFFLVRIILRATLFEFIRHRDEERARGRGPHLGGGGGEEEEPGQPSGETALSEAPDEEA